MKRSGGLLLVSLALLFICVGLVLTGTACAEKQPGDTGRAAGSVEQLMAGLSDEQVRQLLIDELTKAGDGEERSAQQMKGPASVMSGMLKTLSSGQREQKQQIGALLAFIPAMGADLYGAFLSLCPSRTLPGAMLSSLWALVFIAAGFIIEYLFRRFALAKYLPPGLDADVHSLSRYRRLLASLTRVVPSLLGLIVFFCGAYFAFTIFYWVESIPVQLLFLDFLLCITWVRVIQVISAIVLAPANEPLRLIPMDNKVAVVSHTLIVWTCGYIIVGLMFAVVAKRLGAGNETVRLLQLFLATFLIAVTAFGAIRYRTQVRTRIIAAGAAGGQGPSWASTQVASIWHILAVMYLFVLWVLLLNDLANPDIKGGGAFILSFFVFPIWMVADRLVQWVVKYAMSTLRVHREEYDDRLAPSEEDLARREQGRALFAKVLSIARTGVVGALAVWVAALWNIRIPLVSELASFLLDAIIILTVALIFWQFLNTWIEHKIEESVPEEEAEEDVDDEWGGAAKRGRAYTLLPMVRKFVATVLMVMVVMMLLSSLGVDIGPLLAGAGVIGLAIGFGAQKLVADIFSGFFYLIDDAFRVGEYLTAGSVSGTVETITLRNVMLRHHRGMLQIIPHSELGAITNFMRGGIVVKFNLDFPYDAPIDKIRKVIKKVGQTMLENEEYGKDFIKPVKSQGVREIANSVMTIRVKFTAQPGTHFVIRREAYRLITEALNAQGIYYAHRKVIVDVSEGGDNRAGSDTGDLRKQRSTAAGAAATRLIEEEENAAALAPAREDPMDR